MSIANVSRFERLRAYDEPSEVAKCILSDGSEVYGSDRPDGWLDVMHRYVCPLTFGTAAFLLIDVLQVKASRTALSMSGGSNNGPAFHEGSVHSSLHLDEYFYTDTAAEIDVDSSGIARELPFNTLQNPRSSRCNHVDITSSADGSIILQPRCSIGNHRANDGLATVGGFSAEDGGRFVIDGLVTAPDRWLTLHVHRKRRFRFVTDAPTSAAGDVRAFVLAPSSAHNRSQAEAVRIDSCSDAIGCAAGVARVTCTCVELCVGEVLRWAVVVRSLLAAVHVVGTCDSQSAVHDPSLVHRARLVAGSVIGASAPPPQPPAIPPTLTISESCTDSVTSEPSWQCTCCKAKDCMHGTIFPSMCIVRRCCYPADVTVVQSCCE